MEGLPEDMWSPYKFFQKIIDRTLTNPSSVSMSELEMCLKKYKQNFATFLKNPPKNERSRNQLRSGLTDGIFVAGNSRKMILSKDIVDESIILSDMFDLDEFIALELLCTAQRQMTRHPGLPRGLVAVLLYYDGRKAITYALRDIFQVVRGVSWVTDVPNELTNLVTSFAQGLVEETNILNRLVTLLEELDMTKESLLLLNNRALGSKKHQNQVTELFEDIRLGLATALFNWSAQKGLPKMVVCKLIQSLCKMKPTQSSGSIDDVTFTLLMALIYAYDTSVLQRQEVHVQLVQSLPILNDADFAQSVYESFGNNFNAKSINGLHSVSKFAFGLSLASLRHTAQTFPNALNKMIENDEQLIDEAIANKLFDFLYNQILQKDILYRNEFFYRRIHMLFTDFIDFMHSKVTEMRGRADETARAIMNFTKEGLEPPANLDNNFELLLLCIGQFYQNDKAKLSLCVEYWGPLDVSMHFSKSTARSVSLFKFVRLAGELLPSTLFVPYLKMIAGLASCERSARNVFNILKQPSGISGSITLSWDHFFSSLSRYFTNLRQEQCAGGDTIYKNRMCNRFIKPHEIEGLQAVLAVIEAVAKHDEVARSALCEHSAWAPLSVLVGLLTCSVPLVLKADILKTLAALAKSRETAIPLWNNIEASQIIPTILHTGSNAGNTCNLEVEIDQNECRSETYPLTQSILDLLYALATTVIPKNLGAGTRKPGFDPYLTFLVNGIFLKFYNRNYRNSAEKWQVGEKCLKLIYHLLDTYTINPLDFEENSEHCSPAGYHIMLQLQTKSDMLQLMLLIIDEAQKKLDEYNKFYGKEKLEDCALNCLKILNIGLCKQDAFFDAHAATNGSILLAGINKLLLDVNPRSGRPDHVLNTTKFVTYSSWLPYHALVSVKILHNISSMPNVTPYVLGIFKQNENSLIEIRQGFVECLENDLKIMPNHTDEVNADDAEMTENDNIQIEYKIKEAIIQLLRNCLQYAAPNLAHFLLGFDVKKDFQGSQSKQRYAIIEYASNCTKSLVQMLDKHLELRSTTDAYDEAVEKIIEQTYALLLSLCMNQYTCDVILRYLRSCNDLLSRHLLALPFKNADKHSVLYQMCTLLKCAAIEMKVAASNCQISRFQHISGILIGCTGKSDHDLIPMELNHYYAQTACLFDELTYSNKPTESNSKLLLFELLNCVDLELKSEQAPKWEFFDSSMAHQIFHVCECKSEYGCKLINMKKLHQTLNDELQTVQNAIASGQRKMIMQEIEAVILFAFNINEARAKCYATVKLMEAWCQITEVLFTCAPDTALSIEHKQLLLLDILQTILSKVVPTQPIFEIAVQTSGTVMLLLVNLRYCYIKNPEQWANDTDTTVFGLSMETSNKNDKLSASALPKPNSLNLKFILKHILDWIIISGVSSQKLRINLYAALLNCLSILKEDNLKDTESSNADVYMTRLDKSIARYRSGSINKQTHVSLEILQSCGEKLIDIICHDCVAGHDVCKMLALSCIDSLLELDSMPDFIHFVANRGYLSHIIENIYKSDENLCTILYNVPENMKFLYVYESQMAMLLRLASTHIGAEILLANGLLEVLAQMRVFDMHPDFQNKTAQYRNNAENAFYPSLDVRYRQIILPALNLCECLITTLGVENYSALSQVLQFIFAHCDMIEMLLRSATPFSDLGILQELSFVTGLIARATNQEIFLCNELNKDLNANIFRVRRLMLATFSRFIINESTFKEMLTTNDANYESVMETTKVLHIIYFLEIAANLALYCRNAIANHSADHQANDVIFAATLTEKIQKNELNKMSLKNNLSIGMVLEQLKGAVYYIDAQKSVANTLLRKKQTFPNILLDKTARTADLEILKKINEKQKEISLCEFITEHCLYLLWSHLDFYVRCCGSGSFTQDTAQQGIISSEELSFLKKNLVSTFNETFCKQLLATASEESKQADKGYTEILLRRVKTLVQSMP